jgi:hypothetical protein
VAGIAPDAGAVCEGEAAAVGAARLRRSVAKDLTADQLVTYCEQIASASGGLFGLPMRAVSMEERNLLTRIASDLKTRKS